MIKRPNSLFAPHNRALIVTLLVAAALTAACVWLSPRLSLSDAPGVFVMMLAPGVIVGLYLGGGHSLSDARAFSPKRPTSREGNLSDEPPTRTNLSEASKASLNRAVAEGVKLAELDALLKLQCRAEALSGRNKRASATVDATRKTYPETLRALYDPETVEHEALMAPLSKAEKALLSRRASRSKTDRAWTVYVDDNFHYMDEDERYIHGRFSRYEDAVAACKKIVDEVLQDDPAKTSEDLYDSYVGFGEDPWIKGPTPPGSEPFSARDYARQRCNELRPKDGG